MFPQFGRDVAYPVASSVVLGASLVVAGLIYQSLLAGAAERLVTVMLIDAIIVLGIQVYVGNTGVLSFGHIGFGAIAGYAFAVTAIAPSEKLKRIPDAPFGLDEIQLSPALAVIAAVVVTVVAAVIIGIGLARSGAESGAVAATVITLALLFVTHEVARNWPDLTGGDRAGLTFRVGSSLNSRIPIYVMLFAAIVVARLFAQSRSGRLAKAAREDNLAARAMGVNPLVQQMIALLMSVAIVSVGASLRVYQYGSILPDNFFFNYTLLTLAMLIVGGRNSVTGALVGVAVMTAGRELARKLGQDGFEFFGLGLDTAPLEWIFRENLQTVFLGLAMLGFMIWRPGGLLADWELDEWVHAKLHRRKPKPSPPPPAATGFDSSSELVVTDVDVSFGGFQALSDAGITVRGGEVVGIIGPNGAGKTTLLNVITGMVTPDVGSVSLNGSDLTAAPSYVIGRAGLARMFQNLRLFESLTVRENVEVSALVAAAKHQSRPEIDVDGLLAAAGLWDLRHTRARELDYGNSRRLELARAAATSPAFLLLDEPTSGMNDTESMSMIEQVRAMAATIGAGVMVIDHDLNFITGICDRIYCFDRGRVIAHGTPAEVQSDPGVRAAYMGETAETAGRDCGRGREGVNSQYPPARRRQRRTSLADEAVTYVRDLILAGSLRPGTKIDQEAVSSALGVSRSPIREALVILGREGLVEVTPRRGASVAALTSEDIVDHYELFGVVAGRAAAIAATSLDDTKIDELTEIHERFEKHNEEDLAALNNEFHRVINSAAPRRTRWLLRLLVRSVPARYYEFIDGWDSQAVQHHEAILEAIKQRDSEGARLAMERHLHESGLAAARFLQRQGYWDNGTS